MDKYVEEFERFKFIILCDGYFYSGHENIEDAIRGLNLCRRINSLHKFALFVVPRKSNSEDMRELERLKSNFINFKWQQEYQTDIDDDFER